MSNAVRQKLSVAFAGLRREGYHTREGDICCQTCGLAEVPDDQAGRYVFYHSQDAMDLRENGSCYLCWSGEDGPDVCPGCRQNPYRGAGCSMGAA